MENEQYRLLLVDDEPDVLNFLSYNLKKEGYQVHTCSNGKEAIAEASRLNPHLIIMDVMMPAMDGIEACREIKQNPAHENTILVFLTARGEDYSQIAGFEAGADDYVTKPVKPRVLISRIKALLRRYREKELDVPVLKIGDLIVDSEKYQVVKNGMEIVLPRKEFQILLLLASRPDKVFTREEIFSRVWGNDVIVGDRTIDVHIRKIREKIGLNNIKTIKGVGYKFELLTVAYEKPGRHYTQV